MIQPLKEFWNKLNPLSKTIIAGVFFFCLQFFIGGQGLKLITGQPTTFLEVFMDALGKVGFLSFFVLVLPFYFGRFKAQQLIFYRATFVSYCISVIPFIYASRIIDDLGTRVSLGIFGGFGLIVSCIFFNFILKRLFSFDVFGADDSGVRH
jgi:hypothetical protein